MPPNDDSVSASSGGGARKADQAKDIELPSGQELGTENASVITAARPTHLIVIAGPVGCGKTTLVTSIYESFQWGPFANFQFVESDTLPGFEQRCYLSRLVSGQSESDTPRTRLGDPAFLHLRVCEVSNDPKDLLLTDLSGESFELARDNTDECRRLEFLKRADHLAILLDCQKLIDPKLRWAVTQDGLTLLQSLLDSEMLPKYAEVDILFSKWDFVSQVSDKKKFNTLCESIEKQFSERFLNRLGRLRFGRIAARPRDGQMSFAFGLDKLLHFWVDSGAQQQPPNMNVQVLGNRESERFKLAKFPGLLA